MKQNEEQKKRKGWRKWFYAGGVLVLAVVIAALVGGFAYEREPEVRFPENWDSRDYSEVQIAPHIMEGVDISKSPEEHPEEYDSTAEYYAYNKKLQEAYENDDFGSSTPEGTFNGFVDALEKRNIERAARYFVPEKQQTQLEEFRAGVENDSISTFLSYIKKGDLKSVKLFDNNHRFQLEGENVPSLSFDLKYNEDTKVWKIESL